MNTSASLVARVAASASQPRSLRAFIPLFIVAGLLALAIFGYVAFKLFNGLLKFRDEKRSESLKQELESGAGHSSVTCCGTVKESKDLKLYPPPITFEAEIEEIAKYHARLSRLSHDMFVLSPSPSTDISPARRSSSIFITRSDSLPLPSRALLYPPSPRRASIPAMWSDPRSRWADENRLGCQGRIRYPSHRPATSPVQEPKELIAPELLRRSITPML
ncbi:unnamed protein product [Rhizoctonia solani]|uniref:Uncharacterized protein n=1 Tax=Rhizoctonia solani TaxID=456999 RepID=A0A8H3DSI6_9AGAM|nr:unnamed protein product [Rhizoctonia solani]